MKFVDKKVVFFLTVTMMVSNLYSQDQPAFDRINTSAGPVEIYFVGHGTLMFQINNYVIHIDPVGGYADYGKLPLADLILVTHEHGDHLDAKLINNLRKDGTKLFCNANSAASVSWAEVMKPGESRKTGNITVEAVHAYNIKNMRGPGQPYHPMGQGNGYIISIGDKRFYIAGDTENTPEMKALRNIDIAFLPMNLPFTMTPEMVADAAKAFKPSILYPYHYGNTNTDDLVNLLKDTNIEVRVRNLK